MTALVTIKSRDYLADARTGEVRDGAKDEWVVTHEFWSFRRDGTTWRLDRVRPAADADELLDVLNELLPTATASSSGSPRGRPSIT